MLDGTLFNCHVTLKAENTSADKNNCRTRSNFEEIKVFVCSVCLEVFPSEKDTKLHQIGHVEMHSKEQEICREIDTNTERRKNVAAGHKENKNKITGFEVRSEAVVHIKVLQGGDQARDQFVAKCQNGGHNSECQEDAGTTGDHSCSMPGCRSRFSTLTHLQIHEECHERGGGWVCPVCQLRLASWRLTALHLYDAHCIDCGLLACPVCKSYRTCSALALDNHRRIHGDLRGLLCHACGRTFRQPAELRSHRTEAHRGVAGTRRRQCNLCFKMYSCHKALHKHKEEVHLKKRPFVCPVCGHSCARRWLLELHQRQHNGHKPFKCRHCDYTTADHNTLRRHGMAHTKVLQYRCQECNYECARSSSLKTHLRRKHVETCDEYIFSCGECAYATISQDRYNNHVSDHLTVHHT